MGPRPEFQIARRVRRRSWVVCSLLMLLMAGHATRLISIQGLTAESLSAVALRQQGKRATLPAWPGDVFDVRGRLLATSVRTVSILVNPRAISPKAQVARSLAAALHLNAQELQERLERNCKRSFMWIKRRVSDQEVRAVRDLRWPRDWVGFRKELKRCYPQGTLASHVLGTRDIDGVGRGGIEGTFDVVLRGAHGFRIFAHDASGKILTIHENLARLPRPGVNVVLTIDSVVQMYAQQALDHVMQEWKPTSATAIVMDPHTGEVLAMANCPTFDPNNGAADSPDAWVNRAISDNYEPGSTFKPFVMAAALDWGLVQPGEVIDCQGGVYRMGPRLLHSHHPYGRLSIAQILIRSDNIGMAIIGQRLANRGLFRAVESFGFGRRTGIELLGESRGLVRPLEQWTSYSTGSIPMGQELAVTPIQLITAFCALANGGRLLRPRIVRSLFGPDGRTLAEFGEPVVVRQPVRRETTQFLVNPVLRGVVEDPHGTGRECQLAGYTAFGKSGTGQLSDGRGGYLPGRHVSSFLAGAAASDPRVVVLVLVNDPRVGKEHYGGRVAAPAAAEILRRTLIYLGVPPDREINDAA